MSQPQWKLTFPIQKAEQREDGLYLIGEASGPEVDKTNERMSPEAIEKFALQVNEAAADLPISFRDAHAFDGVLRDLGEITRAWINEDFHLGIEVKLDEDHPASAYLLKKLEKGKQFGMSVAGNVVKYVDEFVRELGKVVRTYYDVVLTEISITTRPAWTPSLGTVLAKAIDEAQAESSEVEGDSPLSQATEELQPQDTDEPAAESAAETEKSEDVEEQAEETTKAEEETVVEDEAEETEKHFVEDQSTQHAIDASYTLGSLVHIADGDESPEAEAIRNAAQLVAAYVATRVANQSPSGDVQNSDDTEETETPVAESTEKSEQTDVATDEDADVEKAGRRISAASRTKLLTAFANMRAALIETGVLDDDASEKSEPISQDGDTTVEKSEAYAAIETELAEVKRSLDEALGRIKELEDMPASAPPLVKSSDEDEVEDEIERITKGLDPREAAGVRLRAGLIARHGR